MSIVIFNEITTEDVLQQLEADGIKYAGLYVDMDNKDERKYVKDSAATINGMLKRLDRARIDKAKDYKAKVEAEAKHIRERLEEANKPFSMLIDEHTARRAKILAEEKAKQAAIDLAKQIESDHEIALLMYNAHLAEVKEREAAELKAQQERDAEIARLAAERATREAEERAEQERRKAEQDRLDAIRQQEQAKLREEQAKQAAIDAEARRVQEAKDAEERAKQAAIQAEEAAKQAAIDAAVRERQRIEAEEQARIAEQQKREANKAHKGKINRAAVNALVAESALTDEQAKAVVTAIAKGLIPNVTINY